MKRIISALCAIALCPFMSFCSKEESKSEAVSFKDDLGYEVSLPSSPERVAVLFSSYAEIWTLAGGNIAATVGEAVERGFASKDTPLVDAGAGKTVNIEILLSYTPDFVIASADIDAQVLCKSALDDANIPVGYFRVECFDDYLRMLDVCTDITDNRDAFEKYGTDVKKRMDDILSSVPQNIAPKILFIRAGSTVAKAKTASEHFACAMLRDLGAYNIADNAPVLLDGLSIEEIMREDPDRIFVSTMGDTDSAVANMEGIFSQRPWQTLSAVRDGECHYLPKELFQYKPNHRWAEAYEYLMEILYGN